MANFKYERTIKGIHDGIADPNKDTLSREQMIKAIGIDNVIKFEGIAREESSQGIKNIAIVKGSEVYYITYEDNLL